jgi:LacI family transcriptional regulator
MMPLTIRELSLLAGVSTATVSLVLSGKAEGRVGPARRKAILELAEKNGYVSNPAAKGLAEGRAYRIALCVEGRLLQQGIIGNFSLYERMGLAAQQIQAAGYAIEIVQADTKRPPEDVCRQVARHPVDGFVFLAWSPVLMEPVLLSLRDKRRPAVAIGSVLKDDGFTWSDVDRYGAFAEATRQLLGEGRRRVALLDTNEGGIYTDLKRKAFADTIAAELGANTSVPAFAPERFSFSGVVALTERALRQVKRPEGILLTDNFYAEPVLYALHAHGLKPGKDCRLIGFGETDLADKCVPRLSHYSLRIADQVSFCMEALFEQIQSPADYAPRHVLFGPEYVARET